MSWDPALLRKYSSTGHFRLLNQLKGDLLKGGLDRDRSTVLCACLATVAVLHAAVRPLVDRPSPDGDLCHDHACITGDRG